MSEYPISLTDLQISWIDIGVKDLSSIDMINYVRISNIFDRLANLIIIDRHRGKRLIFSRYDKLCQNIQSL